MVEDGNNNDKQATSDDNDSKFETSRSGIKFNLTKWQDTSDNQMSSVKKTPRPKSKKLNLKVMSAARKIISSTTIDNWNDVR